MMLEINKNNNSRKMDPPLLPITLPETLETVKGYECAHDKCVVIASYPKSGTTWMQVLVYELLNLERFRKTGVAVELSHISDYW